MGRFVRRLSKPDKKISRLKRGFSIFESVITAVISLALAAQFMQQMQDSEQSIKANNVALKMRTLVGAADNYVKANQIPLLNGMADNQILMLPLNGNDGPIDGTLSLSNSGVLPANYNFQLPYGQTPVIFIRKIPIITKGYNQYQDSRLEAMVTTYGGQGYNDRLLGEVVQKMGAKGGAIMNTPFPRIPKGTLQGAYGTWSYPPTMWNSGAFPMTCGGMGGGSSQNAITCGRPVGISSNPVGTISDYLDRYNIGPAEANTMHTDIYFKGNKIINLNTLDGYPGQPLYISSSAIKNNVYTQEQVHICSKIDNRYGCGLIIGDNNSTVMNGGDGWTTLTQNSRGFHITGGQYANLELQGALYIDGDMQNGNTTVAGNHPGGLMLSTKDVVNLWNSNDSFGAHLYQDNPEFLTITGGNGFSGISVIADNNQPSRIQLLNAQIYGDNAGLLSLRTGVGMGEVKVMHTDGSQADLTVDALNLGTSLGASRDGNTYVANIGNRCSPNGRIATIYGGQGEIAVCHQGVWAEPNSVTTNNPKYSQLIATLDASNGYMNPTSDSLMLVAHNPYHPDNDYHIYLTDGSVPCVFNQTGRDSNSRGETCTFLIPRGVGLQGGGFPGGTTLDVYQ